MKLRIAVYGMLLVVAGLALALRLSTAGAQDDHVDALYGHTDQGSPIEIFMSGRRVTAFVVKSIGARCEDGRVVGVGWTPSIPQPNVGYREDGYDFTAHEWPDPRFPHIPGTHPNAWMRGTVEPDARRVDGTITYFETGARGRCASGPVRFTVFR